MATILHLGDDPALGRTLRDALHAAGHELLGATGIPEALQVLARRSVDLVISDGALPALSGTELLELLASNGHDLPLVLITAPHSADEVGSTAIESGALESIPRPIPPARLKLAVGRALALVRLRRENAALRREVIRARHEREILGASVAIERVRRGIATAGAARAAVLLDGEPGTGKGLVARAIHELSDRREGPFVEVSCPSLAPEHAARVLFGHEKGAFAGATRRTAGALERARGGTLVLDEVVALPSDVQLALARALRERCIERVGGATAVAIDARVVATTSRDRSAERADESLRPELRDVLTAITIRLPPLRERREDLPLLAARFAARSATEIGKTIIGIAPGAMALLERHAWPANVRELRTVIERAVLLCTSARLDRSCFDALLPPSRLASPRAECPPAVNEPAAPPVVLPEPPAGAIVLDTLDLDDAEAVLIRRALEATRNNRTRAAALLGISVRTLRNKLNGTRRPAPAAR